MKKQLQTIEYIKRQAKKLKKERNITHTQALELLAKEYGYSNWQHCQRSFNEEPVSETKSPMVPLEISFTEWLKKHKNRNSPLGDLATDMLRDTKWPLYDTKEEYRDYLIYKNAYYRAIEALERAWKSYKAYLKRKNNPDSIKPRVKKPVIKKHDSRKIVFVSNATKVPYTERTVEKFSPGDPAWISWDGRKAIPVTVVEVDDRHYSFRNERPLKDAGGLYSVFLDEIRSTPELACMNYVTF